MKKLGPKAAAPPARRAAGLGLESRRAALEILTRVEQERAFADVLLGHRLPAFPPHDRRLITSLVLGVIAWRGRLDYEIAILSGRKIEKIDALVLAILRLGLYQLRFLTRTARHAVVDTSVTLAKENRASRPAAGLVNAMLRRAAVEQAPMPDRARDPAGYLAVACSHPRWLAERFVQWFGPADAASVLAANNQAAPNAIRLNLARGKRDRILDRLRNDGFDFEPEARLPETAILRAAPDFDSPAYREGLFHVQSEASQLVARLLAPPAGATVIDCAAAPGGKATHLAELVGERGKVIAVDINHTGLLRTRAIAERLGHRNLRIVEADMAVSAPFRAERFDAVLLDAPCTGLGTLREHPEIRWRLKPGDFARMVAIQARMLENAATLVRPRRALVYAVCSLAPEEGPGVVRNFLDHHPEFTIDRDPPSADGFQIPLNADGYLITRPDRVRLDGFFAARLRRS